MEEPIADRARADTANADCAPRWLITCICCDRLVEPWQTVGHKYGYCAQCYTLLMAEDGE